MRKLLLSLFLSCSFYNLNAQIEWQKCLGGTGYDRANSIQVLPGGGYIVAGTTTSTDGDVSANHGGDGDFWVVKLDNDGNILWQRTMGGSDEDVATSVSLVPTGGYIVAGYSQSLNGDVTGHHVTPGYDQYDCWVVRLDDTGGIVWQKSLGGTENDKANCVIPVNDGGFVIAGEASSYDGDVSTMHWLNDCWIVKLDANGNKVWDKSYGGHYGEVAHAIKPTKDGGYIVAGETWSTDGDVTGNHGAKDMWLLKLGGDGSLQWQRCLGGVYTEVAWDVFQESDEGYMICGSSDSTSGDVTGHHAPSGWADYWMVRTDDTGHILWEKCLGGSGDDNAMSVWPTADGGCVTVGYAGSADGDQASSHIGSYDFWVVKLAAGGAVEWQTCLGGTNPEDGFAIRQTGDGGYILAGLTSSTDGDVSGLHGIGNADAWIVKLGAHTGVNDLETARIIRIVPNPAQDEVRIEGALPARVVVYDMTGRTIQQASNKATLHIANLPAGIYIVRATDTSGLTLIQDRIVKQ